jgi:hypothetical protein
MIVASVAVKKTRYPIASCISISIIGIGYPSFGVVLFRAQKSIKIHNFPESFFSMSTILDTCSAYLHGLIKPTSSN